MTDGLLLAGIVLSHSLDISSTEIALRRPDAMEANFLARNKAAYYGLNVGMGAFEYHKLKSKSRKTKIITVSALTVARGLLFYHNMRVGK